VTEIHIDSEYVAARIPPRRRDSHKGMNGVACVVGGGRIYHGAPYLAAMGALRTGLDIVYVAVPAVISTPVRALSPDLIVIPMPDSKLTRGNANKLVGWLPPELGCIGVGPGLGPQNPDELAYALTKFCARAKGLVVDADALRSSILPVVAGQRAVLTPHAAEFERLFGQKLATDIDERAAAIKKAAADNRVVVLVKGPTDVVSDGETIGLNTTHSPAMTVGGTGDVLTGITTGLMAKGLPGFEAACCALFINGSAGEGAARALGLHIAASDVVDNIAGAMKPFDRLE
jgi:ADP-dependent NAD(P)H-hydrate dehydratase